MIYYIKGELKEAGTDFAVVENHGIGYLIRVPAAVIAKLPAVGSEIQIFTYLYVREDILDLYGFLNRDDMNIFRLLLGVSGIGPKGALAILSTISADELRFAVLAGDAKTIAKAPGIGNKTAQKMVIELKDKLKLEEAFEQKIANEEKSLLGQTAEIQNEAVQALTALGYSPTDALRAVRAVTVTEEMTVEALLKASLKTISR
ncbi:MAG: Holliday junction branch migration protein RuvA [Lachnospiraceae bacterium]|nr:Holliday junction branch migration protein RuvA [Lachnospiraceae bacterium]